MTEELSKFRIVNQSLGDTPSVGPLPGNQFIPWACLIVIAWMFNSIFSLGLLKTGCLAAWLIGSWSLVTGSKPWRFMSKLTSVPYWACGYLTYKSLLDN